MLRKKTPVKPETSRERYEFRYQLSYREAFEAFRNLAERGNRTLRLIAIFSVGLIAAGLLIGYAMDTTKVHFIYMAFMSVFLLFYLVYVPSLTARRGAAKVAKANGSYQVTISSAGQIRLPRLDPIQLNGDKNARSIETNHIFVIRTDSSHTVCIPKRVMREGEIEDVRRILQAYMKYYDRRQPGADRM